MKKVVSFTKVVKEEVSLYEGWKVADYRALLSSFIKINGHLLLRNNEWLIFIRSENIKVAKLIIKLLKKLYPESQQRIIISEKKKLRVNSDNKVVNIEVQNGVKEILKELAIYSEEKGFTLLPAMSYFKNMEMRKAYLAGAFLASGSVNSPQTKNYHLEIAVETKTLATYLQRLLKKFYLEAKLIKRRKQIVVYLKKSDQIADFLKMIGAWNSLLHYEGIRIQRDQYNSLNRLYNCEIANERRALEKGNEQAALIDWYASKIGLEKLDPPLRIVAEARLSNPDATYLELTDYIRKNKGVSLSKSGLSYRLTKLINELETLKGIRK